MNKTRAFLHIIVSIKYSLQQQIHFNGNIFGNKFCRCNEVSLYSLGAFWVSKDAMFLHADNEDTGQTARMRRLIWVFVENTCQKVRFLSLRLQW